MHDNLCRASLGDDLYYLGLTYTLVSVVHALYAFTGAANADGLVSDFSVALLTTLAGIVGRVLLYEKHASQKPSVDVEDGIARLGIEIEGAVRQMHEFRRGLALNVEQASESALQNVNSASASFNTSAKQMTDAATAMSASLRKGVNTFDKSFGRIGEASEALGARVSELVETTRTLGSLSEVLKTHAASLGSSAEDQTRALVTTLESQSVSTRRIGAELDSLIRPVSQLVGSMDEMRRQIDTTKQEFGLTQFKTAMADTVDAAGNLGRNFKLMANALEPSQEDANFSVLKAFAAALAELTAEIQDSTYKLAALAEQSNKGSQPQRQFPSVSNGDTASQETASPAHSASSLGTQTNDDALSATHREGITGRTLAPDAVAPNGYSSSQEDKIANDLDRALETRGRAWWSWRRD